MADKERYDELVQLIQKANLDYYTLDCPSITDNEYDSMMVELLELEKKHPEYVTENSPSQKVGNKILDGFKKVNRTEQMASLADVFNENELSDWYDKTMTNLGGTVVETVAEMKIDGLSIELVYDNGQLQYAATRGDGFVGEDVTENIRTIPSVPKVIIEKGHVEVRGEVYLPKKQLEIINAEQIANGKPTFANCRNLAAGTLKNLDTSVCKKRKLDVWIYYFWNASDYGITDHFTALTKLKEMGFKTNPEARLIKNKTELLNYVKEYTGKRNSLDYDIDGIVLKVNSFSHYKTLGKTAKVPHWAIAYKFPPELVITKLNDITWQVGRTGKLTPVAELSPVLVSGSMVARATLHNEDFIKDKGIMIGDYVVIKKAGDVIPAVDSVVTDRRDGTQKKFVMIDTCPDCGKKLTKVDAHIFCTNDDCPSRLLNRIIHFCEKEAMDIDGMGEKTCELLVNNSIISKIEDIYTQVKYEKIVDLDGFSDVSANNLINGINASKNNSLEKLLCGLGIKEVGHKMAEVLAKHFLTYDNLASATEEDLLNIPDVGPIAAKSIYEFTHKFENQYMIGVLKDNEVNMKYLGNVNVGTKLKDKVIVITGTLSKPRSEFEKLIKDNGGKVSGSVSKKTSYLLAADGEESSTKYKTAVSLGIEIINEDKFNELIK